MAAANLPPPPMIYDVDWSKVVVKPPAPNKHGGKSAYITYKDGSPVRFQLTSVDCPLRAPFGVSEPYTAGQEGRRTMDLSVDNLDLCPHLNVVDEFLRQVAIKNCEEWFKKKMSAEKISDMYKTLLTPDESGKGYAPLVRTKVELTASGISDRVIKVSRMNVAADGTRSVTKGLSHHDIKKFSKGVVVVELSAMWFMTKEFGASMVATGFMLTPIAESGGSSFNWGSSSAPAVVDEASSSGASATSTPAATFDDSKADEDAEDAEEFNFKPPEDPDTKVIKVPGKKRATPTAESAGSGEVTKKKKKQKVEEVAEKSSPHPYSS
jgi:hypothetical protein